MRLPTLEETGRCLALTTDGRYFVIIRWTNITRVPYCPGPERLAQEIHGTSLFETDDGRPVELLGKGRYKISDADGDIEATCDDPNAL
jgi:hypothetical protein